MAINFLSFSVQVARRPYHCLSDSVSLQDDACYSNFKLCDSLLYSHVNTMLRIDHAHIPPERKFEIMYKCIIIHTVLADSAIYTFSIAEQSNYYRDSLQITLFVACVNYRSILQTGSSIIMIV